MYTEHCFVKSGKKSISAALLDILRLCVLTAGPWAQSREHYLWRERMRFSRVSRCWKEEHAACPSPSMVPAATPYDRTLSLLRQTPLRGSCCICIGVNVFKPTPLAGRPESNLQKDLMAGKGIVYYKVMDDWPAASQTLSPEKRGALLLVASIILSTPAIGAKDVSSLSPALTAFYLKQVGDIHGLPSDKHRDCFSGRKRSAG